MAASTMSVSEEQQLSSSEMAAMTSTTQISQSYQRMMESKERRSSAGLVEPRKISDTALANLGSEVDSGQVHTSYMSSEAKR